MRATSRLAARRAAGFSLVEIAMVLAIIALLVAGVMLFFTQASMAEKANETAMELLAIQDAVHTLYAGQPDYSNVTPAVIAASRLLPQKWVSGTGVKSPFNSWVYITPDFFAGPSQFAVQITGIPRPVCQALFTKDWGPSVQHYWANGLDLGIQGRGLTPAEASSVCSQSVNSLAWAFQ